MKNIDEIKMSDLQETNSALQTIISTVNSMLGSTVLIIPIYFANHGILNCFFAMLIHAFINYKTCNILITHGRFQESDIPEIIYRIMGKKYHNLYSIMSSSLLFLVGTIYYLIQCDMLYNVSKFVFAKLDWQLLPKNYFSLE